MLGLDGHMPAAVSALQLARGFAPGLSSALQAGQWTKQAFTVCPRGWKSKIKVSQAGSSQDALLGS